MADQKIEFNEELSSVVKRFRDNRDEESFELLYKMTYKKLYAYVQMMSKNKEKTYDVLQNSYMICFRKIEQLSNPSKFMSWMKNISYHELAHSYDDREVILGDNPSEDEDFDFFDSIRDEKVEMPEKAVEDQNLKRLIWRNINTLPNKQRMAVIAFYYEDSSIKEISEALGAPENTVKTYLNRARKALNASMKAYADSNGLKMVPLGIIPFMSVMIGEEASACELTADSGNLVWNLIKTDIVPHTGINSDPSIRAEKSNVLEKTVKDVTKKGTITDTTNMASSLSTVSATSTMATSTEMGIGLKIFITGAVSLLVGTGIGAIGSHVYIENYISEGQTTEDITAEADFVEENGIVDNSINVTSDSVNPVIEEPDNDVDDSTKNDEENDSAITIESGISEQELREKLIKEAHISDNEIYSFLYNDYDKDGINEAFSIIKPSGQEWMAKDEIWYVSKSTVKRIKDKADYFPLEENGSGVDSIIDTGDRLWVIIAGVYADREADYIYSVKDGDCYESRVTSNQDSVWFESFAGNNLIVNENGYEQAIDGGKTTKALYFYYDPSVADFIE